MVPKACQCLGMTQQLKDFADAVGRRRLAKAVGVNPNAVTNGITRGAFPARWYVAAVPLAQAAGVKCDPALFGMASASDGIGSADE